MYLRLFEQDQGFHRERENTSYYCEDVAYTLTGIGKKNINSAWFLELQGYLIASRRCSNLKIENYALYGSNQLVELTGSVGLESLEDPRKVLSSTVNHVLLARSN